MNITHHTTPQQIINMALTDSEMVEAIEMYAKYKQKAVRHMAVKINNKCCFELSDKDDAFAEANRRIMNIKC